MGVRSLDRYRGLDSVYAIGTRATLMWSGRALTRQEIDKFERFDERGGPELSSRRIAKRSVINLLGSDRSAGISSSRERRTVSDGLDATSGLRVVAAVNINLDNEINAIRAPPG